MSQPPTVVGQVEQLQLPDVHRPERMPSWPEWVVSHIASLQIEMQPNSETGKWRKVPTLPANSILMAAEREELERHVKQLDALSKRTPINDPQAEQDTLVAVTKMMVALPSMTQNELSAEVRGEAFMAALDDVPAWAVQAAVRRWYRGECGKNAKGMAYDCHWCPAPAELRCIALAEMRPLNERLHAIEALLRAEPRREFNEEHRRSMCARLTELSMNLRTSLVGKTAAVEGSA